MSIRHRYWGLYKAPFQLLSLELDVAWLGLRKELGLFDYNNSRCQFSVGDYVKCYYADAGHKWWAHILEPYAIVDKIKYDKDSKLFRLRFQGEESFFYENDFYKF